MKHDSTSESGESDDPRTDASDALDTANLNDSGEPTGQDESKKKTLSERVLRKIRKVDGPEKPNIYPLF